MNATPSRYTLHRVDTGAYAVVVRDITGTAITGHAGYTHNDVLRALADENPIDLRDWTFLELTPESAAYVAATFPVVYDQQVSATFPVDFDQPEG